HPLKLFVICKSVENKLLKLLKYIQVMSLLTQKLTFATDENAAAKKPRSSGERRRFGMLQPNVLQQAQLLTTNGKLSVNSPKKGKKRRNDENAHCNKVTHGIYVDTAPPAKKQKTFASICTQTDDSVLEKIIIPRVYKNAESSESKLSTTSDMLTSDTAPPEYWKVMAEKRREALNVTLEENKHLYEENENLKTEVKELKHENSLLEEMVNDAKQLAELVQTITEAEEESESETEEKIDVEIKKTQSPMKKYVKTLRRNECVCAKLLYLKYK
ncbi:unnamed protein product, partial [Meganyctiphanes norvegica]